MEEDKTLFYTEIRAVEDELIQISGLMKALQKIQPDDGASTCVLNAVEERFESLQQKFYQHWKNGVRQ